MPTSIAVRAAPIAAAVALLVALPRSAAAPPGRLVLAGDAFVVADRPAFLFAPAGAPAPAGRRPWVLYAPTLPAYPDEAERWMHERFTRAGIAVAGVDTGESYGSPAAVAVTEALHAEMMRRGYAAKPAVLGRSRGGLWAAAWVIRHPEWSAGLAGIYPVYDWRTYPGVEKAAPAYGMDAERLAAAAAELCPIERIDVAARAGVPVCIIHGDEDTVVPLGPNSARLRDRYAAAGRGELVNLVVATGKGHDFWEGFFRCEVLADFVVARARAGAAAAD